MSQILIIQPDFPLLDQVKLDKDKLFAEKMLAILNVEERVVPLQNDIFLHVVDDKGFRFWAKGDHIIQLQVIVLKDGKDLTDPKFPESIFTGIIYLESERFPKEISSLKDLYADQLTKDIDSVQYGLNIYYLVLGFKKYTIWGDHQDQNITSIFF